MLLTMTWQHSVYIKASYELFCLFSLVIYVYIIYSEKLEIFWMLQWLIMTKYISSIKILVSTIHLNPHKYLVQTLVPKIE